MPRDDDFTDRLADLDDPIDQDVALAQPVLIAAQRELIPLLLQLAGRSPDAARYAIVTLNRHLLLVAEAARPIAGGHPAQSTITPGPLADPREAASHPASSFVAPSASPRPNGPRHLRDWQHLAARERTQLRRYVLLAELETAEHPLARQELVAAVHREGFDASAGDTDNAIGTQLSRMKETRQVASPPASPGRFKITDGGKEELAKLRAAFASNIRG